MTAELKKASYSNLIKSEILSVQLKKDCCRRAFLDGAMFVKGELLEDGVSLCVSGEESALALSKIIHSCYGVPSSVDELVGDIYLLNIPSEKARNRMLYLEANDVTFVSNGKCPSCKCSFLKGLFLVCGRFTDPNKSFQLEFSAGNRYRDLINLLDSIGIEMRHVNRKNENIVYTKNSVTIEDFFTFIGANNAVFELMNIKIENELRNNANRIANCETNNINKAVSAAAVQIEAIKYLKENNLISSLPQEIAETAELRFANPELSISQLCIVSNKGISKSGMNHRLSKIVEAYRQALAKQQNNTK